MHSTGISPCFGEGSGLKHRPRPPLRKQLVEISPCFGEGSGLKHLDETGDPVTLQNLPLLR